ncbi:MAG TPA: N-acetylmuramoyl-L-alanine amidase-like domain-containing protein, partial [Armatimonadota bacterium]|nr:N-acetylmuramoyl-L-alanine amidase-like domain-containing protein [Armatimonadota bacterium]
AETVQAGYIPREVVPSVIGKIPSGTIGLFVLDKPDIVAGHLGFLFRKDGQLLLRHASQTRKEVIEEPLTTYLQRAPKRFIGMEILQPDVAGLKR